MRKVAFLLLSGVLSLFADDVNSSVKNAIKKNFPCSYETYAHFLLDKNLINLGGNNTNDAFIDVSSIAYANNKIDKAKVWIVYVYTKKGYKKNGAFVKSLKLINLKNNQMRLLSSVSYDCSGDVLHAYTSDISENMDYGWEYVTPGTLGEAIFKATADALAYKQ